MPGDIAGRQAKIHSGYPEYLPKRIKHNLLLVGGSNNFFLSQAMRPDILLQTVHRHLFFTKR